MKTTPSNIANKTVTIMPAYAHTIMLLERLHRRMQEVVKDALDRAKIDEINAVQALMLYNIADQELTVSELRARDYYTGSNSSYNVKKLVEAGYICYAKSRVDRRCARISLGERGKEIHALVARAYERHARTLDCVGGVEVNDLSAINHSLGKLDRFWADQIQYRL
jgi:DNA-binding MarR family transcriptional regulator